MNELTFSNCSYRLSKVVEDAIKDYFETRLSLLEPIFPIACHRLGEGPDFSLDFSYKPPYNIPEGTSLVIEFIKPLCCSRFHGACDSI